jgi:hypothetical protein
MKWSIALAFAAALLVGSQPSAGGDKQPPAKQFQSNVLPGKDGEDIKRITPPYPAQQFQFNVLPGGDKRPLAQQFQQFQFDVVPGSPAKQLQFNIVEFEGDPLGSQHARTLKVLNDSRLVIRENHAFSQLIRGGHAPVPDSAAGVEFGLKLQGKTGAVKDDKVRLDITLSNTTVEGDEERIQFNAESTRTITTVTLGEVVKLRWGKGNADRQTWVELSVKEVKP